MTHPMPPRVRGLIKLAILLGVFAFLLVLFPKALAFTEMAAREIRYLWWLILLVALAIWLIWGVGRKSK